jgi:hypothetical protein
MTPKEKADELYCKYIDAMPHPEHSNIATYVIAKRCSLIAVDEIINTLNYDIRDLDVRGNILLDLIKYWREVKQEIEKL